MKTVVINLPQRADRLSEFKKINDKHITYEVFNAVDGYAIDYDNLLSRGFDIYHQWIDPILKTKLTKGEVGCFLSHWEIWKKCVEKNEPILVLEDDAIITHKFSYDELYQMIDEGYGFVYLGWKEMAESLPIDNKFVEPVYPYWTLSYMITPECAKLLLNNYASKHIVPVDEYLPKAFQMLKDKSLMNVCAYKENVVVPRSRNDGGSDVLAKSRYDYFVDFHTTVGTVATDTDKARYLFYSASKKDTTIVNLGKGVKWEGGTMKGQGGGHKINLVKEYLKDKRDSDVFIFLDGYDTFLTDSTDEIISRYMEFSQDIVFSSERFCWPDEGLASELRAKNFDQSTPYQYLNSGMYIGRIGALRELFKKPIENYEDDQLYVQRNI